MPVDLKNARKVAAPDPEARPLSVPSRRVDTLDEALLDPGDSIEFSTSYNIKFPDRTEMWVKVGASTKVRESETTNDAADRLGLFVIQQMTVRVQAAATHNQNLVIEA